jgi:RNA polymerase sigma-70 factor, ECF subfamily
MGAVADEIARALAEGQEVGEDRPNARTSELSRETWKELFGRLATGDATALETLYRAAGRQIFGLALWRTGCVEDASDVVQEVFLRLAQRHRGLGKVRDPKSWLLGVAHHVAVDVTRRRKRRAAERLDEVPFLAAAECDGARAIDAARASSLLGQLPPAQRDVIYLRHFADCTFAVIGDITGVPTFTAASQLPPGDREAAPPHGGNGMNDESRSVKKVLATLQPPEPPRGLQQRVLRGAREALARETGRDVWTRIWESRPLRVAWAWAVVVLVICHVGITELRSARSSATRYVAQAAREGSGELGEIGQQPRLDENARPLLGVGAYCLAEEPESSHTAPTRGKGKESAS